MNFDKFIDSTLIKERSAKKREETKEENPRRELAKKYREKPANRITYTKK